MKEVITFFIKVYECLNAKKKIFLTLLFLYGTALFFLVDKQRSYFSYASIDLSFQEYGAGDFFFYDGKWNELRKDNFHLANQISWNISSKKFKILATSQSFIIDFLSKEVSYKNKHDFIINHIISDELNKSYTLFSNKDQISYDISKDRAEELTDIIAYVQNEIIYMNLDEERSIINMHVESIDPALTLMLKQNYLELLSAYFNEGISSYKQKYNLFKIRKDSISNVLDQKIRDIAVEKDKLRGVTSQQFAIKLNSLNKERAFLQEEYDYVSERVKLTEYLEEQTEDKFKILSNLRLAQEFNNNWKTNYLLSLFTGIVFIVMGIYVISHIYDIIHQDKIDKT